MVIITQDINYFTVERSNTYLERYNEFTIEITFLYIIGDFIMFVSVIETHVLREIFYEMNVGKGFYAACVFNFLFFEIFKNH